MRNIVYDLRANEGIPCVLAYTALGYEREKDNFIVRVVAVVVVDDVFFPPARSFFLRLLSSSVRFVACKALNHEDYTGITLNNTRYYYIIMSGIKMKDIHSINM